MCAKVPPLNPEVTLAGRRIGLGHPCFVIAELGVNHNGDIALAKRLIDAAARVGADAIKFQTFNTDLVVDATASKADYQKNSTDSAETQLEMIRRLELPQSCWGELKAYVESFGLVFLSTPFDLPSAHLLMNLGMEAIKIPSGEITNLPFLDALAAFGAPMIVSTGMADIAEVGVAAAAIERKAAPYCLLHCVSNYPADPADANLRAMQTLESAFAVPVGYSDHTQGDAVALAAVALGAAIVEKHFTVDRTLPGPDHPMSTEPEEFANLVRNIRTVESALGDGRKRPRSRELEIAKVARRSIIAERSVKKGVAIVPEDLGARRTSGGLPPTVAYLFYGRRARRDILAGEPVDFADFEKP